MKATIYNSKASGKVIIPPSKSYLHRYIIAGALAKGITIIKNFALSDDILATINALKPFGIEFNINNDELKIKSQGLKRVDDVTINVNESASTLRFLCPVLSLFANKITFTGSAKLLARPMEEFINIFGQDIIIRKDKIEVFKPLSSSSFYLDGNTSSQFVSGLLFALPLMHNPSTIIIQGNLVSKNYVDLTIECLKDFGVNVKKEENVIYVLPHQEYIPCLKTIEGDYSQAANFIVLAKINNQIEIEGLNKQSLQGDKLIYDLLEKDEIDLNNNIDLGPILFVYASTLEKQTKFIGTNRLTYKEADRLLGMKQELTKFGIEFNIYDDVCFIKGKKDLAPCEELSSHNDHRICMALAILASIATHPCTINNIECVNKSYPNFFKDLERLGIKISYSK